VTDDPRLRPPSGEPAPTSEALPDGTTLRLVPLAEEACRRYQQEFPDEEARYGAAGEAWCIHDNQYLFGWAALDLEGTADLTDEVTWLGEVLEARGFPIERLVRGLVIAAAVASERVAAPWGGQLAAALTEAAGNVRQTFLSD
jgi:hypothetical protein